METWSFQFQLLASKHSFLSILARNLKTMAHARNFFIGNRCIVEQTRKEAQQNKPFSYNLSSEMFSHGIFDISLGTTYK